MKRAAMPETPIDEDGNLQPRKYDIGLAPYVCQRPAILKETQTTLEKRLSERHFNARSAWTICLHRSPDAGG